MAKRRSLNRLSGRFSQHRSASHSSNILDPDTNVIEGEQTSWWDNLEDNTILPYSLIHDKKNETTKQLNFNSQLDSSYNTEWWKNLESSDNEHNTSTNSRRNLSAAILKGNILETSTSESEEKINVRKRKVPLRAASRKSSSNAFLNVLSNTKVTNSTKLLAEERSTEQKKHTSLEFHKNASDENMSGRTSHENKEKSINLSPTVNILKLRPNIFKKKGGQRIEDQNAFQNVLTEEILSDVENNSISIKKSPKSLVHRKNDVSKNHKNNQTKVIKSQSPKVNADDALNISMQKAPTLLENDNASDINKTVQSSGDESDVSHEIVKVKSHILRPMRKKIEKNAFEGAFVADENVSSLKHRNLSQEIDIHDAKSQLPKTLSLLDSVKKSINKSKKIDVHDSAMVKNTSIRRSLRSWSSNIVSNKQSLSNTSPLIQDTVEQNSGIISSSDDSGTHNKNTKFLKPKSRFLERLKHKRNSIKNPFEEAFEEENDIIAKEDNTAFDAHISTGENEVAEDLSTPISAQTKISQSHDFLMTEGSSRSKRNRNTRALNNIQLENHLTLEEEEINAKLHEKYWKKRRVINSNSQKNVSNIEISEEESHGNTNKRLSDIYLKLSSSEGSTYKASVSRSKRNRNTRALNNIQLENHLTLEEEEMNAKLHEKYWKKRRVINSNSQKNVSNIEISERESHGNTNKKHSDISLKLSSSEGSTYKASVPKIGFSRNRSTKVSESDDVTSVTKSTGRKSTTSETSEKQIFSNRKSKENMSRPSKERMVDASLIEGTSNANETHEVSHEVTNDNMRDDVNVEHDLSTLAKRLSKPNNIDFSSPVKQLSASISNKETRSTRSNTRKQSETPKFANKDITELSAIVEQPIQRNIDMENISNINVDSKIEANDIPQERSSTKNLKSASTDKGMNIVIDKGDARKTETTELKEMYKINEKDVTPAESENQQDSPSSENRRNNRRINRQTLSRVSTVHNLDSANQISENRETSREQSSRAQNDHSALDSKINSPRSRKMIDFFKMARSSTALDTQSTSKDRHLVSQTFKDTEKMKKIKEELERIKSREIAKMKIADKSNKKEPVLSVKNAKLDALKQNLRKRKLNNPTRVVDKAFLVNGMVYKAPKLLRPKHWVTDHLYKFLWKRMEPKYKLATRVRSEKFVQELAKMVTLIGRRKKYDSYKTELEALMKEMARLQIIISRNDFYKFCQDFLPFEFRVKVVPMLLPGNKNTVPYDPKKLYTPLINEQD